MCTSVILVIASRQPPLIALAHVWCGRQLVRELWPLAFDHGLHFIRDMLDAFDIEHVFYEGA
jgi:hypothetical protein